MNIVQDALTFDDVLLQPSHSLVLPNQVQLKTRLTREIALNIPLLSAAMDTVTDSRLAIAMGAGGRYWYCSQEYVGSFAGGRSAPRQTL